MIVFTDNELHNTYTQTKFIDLVMIIPHIHEYVIKHTHAQENADTHKNVLEH